MSFTTYFVFLISFGSLYNIYSMNSFGKIRCGCVKIVLDQRDATAASSTGLYSSVSNEPAVSNGNNPRVWTNRKITGEKEGRFVHPQVCNNNHKLICVS